MIPNAVTKNLQILEPSVRYHAISDTTLCFEVVLEYVSGRTACHLGKNVAPELQKLRPKLLNDRSLFSQVLRLAASVRMRCLRVDRTDAA